MKKAIFPGTFDPFTIGHFSVVKRALTFMDEIIIGIGVNDSKRTWFPTERRVEMIRALYADKPRISVEAYSGLTVDFARERGAGFWYFSKITHQAFFARVFYQLYYSPF